MNTKTSVAALTAGLALIAAPAFAEKPDRAKKDKQPKGAGFTLAGVDVTGLTVTDGKLGGPLTLDPTSANKHARTFLAVSREFVAGEGTVPVGTAGDAVRVRFVGLTATDKLLPTDRVKVIGKVTRVRKGDSTTVRTLNIRKITITRSTEESGS